MPQDSPSTVRLFLSKHWVRNTKPQHRILKHRLALTLLSQYVELGHNHVHKELWLPMAA
jgi:hypothetical protein